MAEGCVVLLTGATGFIGTHIARRLCTDTACTLVALVRADTAAEAAQRLARAWWEWPELVGGIGERVQVRLLFELFNVLNRQNPAAVQNRADSPLRPTLRPFGTADQVLPGREGQVGIRIQF